MNEEKFFEKRRIGVCGTSVGLSKEERFFCEEVGKRLAEDPNVVIVSSCTMKKSGKQRMIVE